MTNLDDALQDLSEAVQQRLVVLDEGMRVIAYSIHESEPDRARLSHLLAHSDTRQAPAAGTDGVGTHTASDGTQWVLHPLRDDRHRVGHLLHVRAKGVPSPPEDVLTEGAAQLGVLLSLRTMYAERDAARARGLLTELLGEHSTEIGRASAARALVDEELVGSAGQYCAVVLAVPPGHPGGDWEARRAVDATLDFVSRTSTATVVGGVVEGLGVPVFPRPVVQDRLERVLGAPGLAHVRAGIGGVVDDLLSVATSHEQARRARRAACLDPLTHPRVTEWSGLGIDKLLLALPPGPARPRRPARAGHPAHRVGPPRGRRADARGLPRRGRGRAGERRRPGHPPLDVVLPAHPDPGDDPGRPRRRSSAPRPAHGAAGRPSRRAAQRLSDPGRIPRSTVGS
uniref:Uncharacterized protein n=1 Tax=Janibacter limosus TaxID=53458 RepID=A0AC61U7K0_9MICO|nr:hypothetical protein [Janibacter limosus]